MKAVAVAAPEMVGGAFEYVISYELINKLFAVAEIVITTFCELPMVYAVGDFVILT